MREAETFLISPSRLARLSKWAHVQIWRQAGCRSQNALSRSLSSSEAEQRYEYDAADGSCGSCGPHLVALDRLARVLEDALVRLLRSCRRDGGIVGSGGRGRQDDGRLDLGLEGRLGGRRGRWRDGEGGGRGGDGVERGLRLLDELLQALEVLLRRGVTLLRVFAQPVARRKASAGA